MFLSEDEARYDDILKLFNHYKTLANNTTMTKFATLWEGILFPKLAENHYYPNIRYSDKWNKQYIEHYLIDGNNRAIHSRNSFLYNFKIELLSQSDLSVFCFDSYIDFISYHWITSKQHLTQLDNAEDIEYFLNFLEAFLQENQNNMSHGLLNPYTANE